MDIQRARPARHILPMRPRDIDTSRLLWRDRRGVEKRHTCEGRERLRRRRARRHRGIRQDRHIDLRKIQAR